MEIKLIRFTANWCNPCSVLSPVIEGIKTENPDVIFQTVDVDDDVETMSLYGVKGLPTVVITVDGKEVDRIVGVNPANRYADSIKKQRGS